MFTAHEYLCVCVCVHLAVKSHLTPCNPMECSPLGCFVHGILQARILEWIAFPSLVDLHDPRIDPGSPALQEDSLPSEPPGKPRVYLYRR